MNVLIIPTRNEERNIKRVLLLSKRYVDKIIVADSSTDKTAEIAESVEGVEVVRVDEIGKGVAIKKAVEKLGQRGVNLVLIMDANERNPQDLEKLIKYLEFGYDVVIGERRKMRSLERKLLNGFGTFCFNFMTGLRFRDIFSGFLGIKYEKLRTIKIEAVGFEVEINFILEIWKNKLSIKRIPIEVPTISKSRCRIKDFISISLFFDRWFIERKELVLSKKFGYLYFLFLCIAFIFQSFLLKL